MGMQEVGIKLQMDSSSFVSSAQNIADTVFDEEGVYEYRERCNILRRCMRVQDILGDIGISSEKDDYEFDCAAFLEGSWRTM